MNTVGFPISHKENEKRRAILPAQVKLIRNPNKLFIEHDYGKVLGIPDEEYKKLGVNICSHGDTLSQDIICDPKVGDADYLEKLRGQTVFGWIHATQNRNITDAIVNRKLTAFAWEKMYDRGRHVFWRNNELAGEAAIMHAFQCYGKMPYETKVAVIGRGNTSRGAIKILNMLGATVVQYNRYMEALLREEIGEYDVIVNCILWDVMRTDHIIYKSDLQRMKPGSMIIDVSCDKCGGIETSTPTTIENPTYVVDGIIHYAVDHTPALFHKTFTTNNSIVVWPYIQQLINGHIDEVMENAKVIENGMIIDSEILQFQNR